MNDSHAADTVVDGLEQKFPQRCFRLRNRQPVEIDLALYPIFAAPQPTQHRWLHLRTPEYELIAAGELGVDAVDDETFIEHGGAVGPREARARQAPRRTGCSLILPQRPDAADCILEQTALVAVIGGIVVSGQRGHGR